MHVLINERKIESQTLKSIQLTFNSMTKVMSVAFTILNDLVTINLKMFQLTLDTCSFLALTKVLILANFDYIVLLLAMSEDLHESRE